MVKTEKKKKLNAGRAKSMNKFADALLSLMQKKSFGAITITDLSAEAGLVRKTFYRNFATVESILEFKLDCFFGEIEKKFDFSTANDTDIFEFCFERLLDDRRFISVFTDRGAESTLKAKIAEYVDAAYSDTLHAAASFSPALAEYYSAFIADGIVSVIRTWAESGCKQSPATMAELMHRLLSGVIA